MRHLAVRAADALLLLWLVATLTFLLIRWAPGDPASLLVAPTAGADEIARQRAAFGLDGPLPTQYARWLGATLRGDLGTSLAQARPVTSVLADALPLSLALGIVSLAASLAGGVLVGAWQAARRGRRGDTVVTVVTTTLYAAPHFWLALVLVVAATSGASALALPAWARLPAFGVTAPWGAARGPAALLDVLRHAVLPLTVLTITGVSAIARFARRTIADVRSAPHVTVARARGVPERLVTWRHVIRNGLAPLVVLAGLALPGIVAGSVFVEQVFAWPGVGRTLLAAIGARDYPVVLGATLVYAAAVIASNLVADLAVARLDPRTRAGAVAGDAVTAAPPRAVASATVAAGGPTTRAAR